MKPRLAVPILLSVAVLGLVYWAPGLLARAAAQEQVTTTAAAAATLPGVSGEYEYVGSNKCKKCHIKEYKSWEDTKMAKAFETLKPGQASEAKQKFNLDPAKDYTKDETCLACHTTGYGKAGGYAIPDPNDAKAVRAMSKLEGVGCESCHGPGSAYIDVFEEIMKSRRKYKVDELYAVGLTKIEATTCTECHNDKSPTHTEAFDFEKQKEKKEELHEHVELQQREG